jgi:ABC-type Fe3+ transport system substrate-binding protein
MLQFFSQLMKLPVDAFVYSMEMLVHTMRGIQQIAYQGIDMMAEWETRPLGEVPGRKEAVPDVTSAVLQDDSGGQTEVRHITREEEERHMADKDLNDDMLKLVRYKILFVKRDYEHAFDEEEELVSDNTDEAGYTAWKVAQFIQRLSKDEDVPVPKAWKDYPDAEYVKTKDNVRVLTGFPEDDKKYLRLYYEVLQRYAREKFKYEETQIDILRDISKTLKERV